MKTNYIFVCNGTAYFIDQVGELSDEALIGAAHSAEHAGRWMANNTPALEIVYSSELGTLYKT